MRRRSDFEDWIVVLTARWVDTGDHDPKPYDCTTRAVLWEMRFSWIRRECGTGECRKVVGEGACRLWAVASWTKSYG